MNGQFPPTLTHYVVSGESFDYNCFLSDGIYTGHKFLAHSLSDPLSRDKKHF